MKTSAIKTAAVLAVWAIGVFTGILSAQAQTSSKSVLQLSTEIENYVTVKTRELVSQGKRVDAAKREELARERKELAEKYAAEAELRPNLKQQDFYYLGLLYAMAENNLKTSETMKKFLSEYPPETKGDMIQSARSYIVIMAVGMLLIIVAGHIDLSVGSVSGFVGAVAFGALNLPSAADLERLQGYTCDGSNCSIPFLTSAMN